MDEVSLTVEDAGLGGQDDCGSTSLESHRGATVLLLTISVFKSLKLKYKSDLIVRTGRKKYLLFT